MGSFFPNVMTSLHSGSISYTLHRHSDLFDVINQTEVKDITLGGFALVPFVELIEFSGFEVSSLSNLSFADILFGCLSSYHYRTELLHRMNEFLSTTMQATLDWSITAEELNSGHYIFYRGSSNHFLEFIRISNTEILFNLYPI